MPKRGRGLTALWRLLLAAGVGCAIGLLPWLSRTDPALTVLKARAQERTATPEVLASVRDELGLDAGPLRLLGRWAGGLLRGDAGESWISGDPVLPAVLQALGSSLLLMVAAMVVAVATAAVGCGRTLRLGARGRLAARRPGGSGAAALAALPEFLLASVLATVVGVQLGWLPALGFYGPKWLILPALSLGLPAGALLGRLLADLLPGAFAEPWAKAAAARGIPAGRIAGHAVRRCLPGLLPNLGLFVVGLTGGAVAVEQVFDIPGLGRTTLDAAVAQDLPVLQTSALVLIVLAAVAGGLLRYGAGRASGPALRDGALPTLHPRRGGRRGWAAYAYGAVLLVVVAFALPRDPLALDTNARLRAPSWAHPFGTDSLGRDLLARIGHGALNTLALSLAISAAALLAGLLLGLLPRLSGPLVDTLNAIPPVLAGLLVAGVAGPGTMTPALAVAIVAWVPLAAHTSALLRQERATEHVAAARSLGADRAHVIRRHLLPAVLPPVARHALLRLPGVALALAALGFLGLGTQPPSPEWGLLLAENQPYAERAPWAVLAPAAVLALLGALAVTATGVGSPLRVLRRQGELGSESSDSGRLGAGASRPPGPG
ncbi:ABC transporter permease subunit, partial [Streptomyces sp. A7024]